MKGGRRGRGGSFMNPLRGKEQTSEIYIKSQGKRLGKMGSRDSIGKIRVGRVSSTDLVPMHYEDARLTTEEDDVCFSFFFL